MAPTQAEAPRKQDDKNKLEDEVRLRHFTEEVLDSRQEELQVQERENSVLSRKLESLQQELREAQSQLALARSQSTKKNKTAEGSKDQINRPSPQRKDITEAEAQEAYRALCDNVQRWVEQRIRPVLDDLASGHFRCQPSPSQSTRFVSLLREPATSCLNVWHSDEYHFMALIMQYLWLVFFSRSFYCPLDDGDSETTAAWIDELESAIAKLPRALKNASYLFDIAPGLFVETVSGAKKSAVKVVCRPKVLVYGGEKGGDIPQQAMTLARLLWDYANGSKARLPLPLRNGPPKSKPLVLRRHRSKL
ncbi:hypothetical protein M440DRAFT_1442213 [Trichoderma longibrachiatum ATCC 18648]|uniref:Uncharacterized protein n=1 Tax=Trichoderma longibrachiatum ATCC 18648 TaxID=983965 RepID=A0A2T4BRH4_TRILO|nr:hypothetical protein M440DRAFT_1442213 [Trichoderma longibrachiatum ATCC 18648]